MRHIDDVTSDVTQNIDENHNMIRRILPGKIVLFWQPARKYKQSYHDYLPFARRNMKCTVFCQQRAV